ncbi:hypothetical protein [Mesorhizobium sp. 1B3]|uniref:hypothetical protein n=1 Tax=Mesorhizobium sp. 1B3 TaxID=3243599 RepID=UPI003D98B91E
MFRATLPSTGTIPIGGSSVARMEASMADRQNKISGKRASGSDKSVPPAHRGGDQAREAQQWSGGSNAPKGPITTADKRNENSSAKR